MGAFILCDPVVPGTPTQHGSDQVTKVIMCMYYTPHFLFCLSVALLL